MVNRQYRPEKVLDMEKREFCEQSENQGWQGWGCFLLGLSFCTTENEGIMIIIQVLRN